METLQGAEEVFMTSTTRHVQAVSRIEDLTFRSAPGPITERLSKLFSDYVSEEIAREAGRTAAGRPA
jgi:branched-chain amino acid aminotransferase